jgi:hypothetical protein
MVWQKAWQKARRKAWQKGRQKALWEALWEALCILHPSGSGSVQCRPGDQPVRCRFCFVQ